MDGFDLALMAGAAFVAVTVLVRLMNARHRASLTQLRQQFEIEQQRLERERRRDQRKAERAKRDEERRRQQQVAVAQKAKQPPAEAA